MALPRFHLVSHHSQDKYHVNAGNWVLTDGENVVQNCGKQVNVVSITNRFFARDNEVGIVWYNSEHPACIRRAERERKERIANGFGHFGWAFMQGMQLLVYLPDFELFGLYAATSQLQLNFVLGRTGMLSSNISEIPVISGRVPPIQLWGSWRKDNVKSNHFPYFYLPKIFKTYKRKYKLPADTSKVLQEFSEVPDIVTPLLVSETGELVNGDLVKAHNDLTAVVTKLIDQGFPDAEIKKAVARTIQLEMDILR